MSWQGLVARIEGGEGRRLCEGGVVRGPGVDGGGRRQRRPRRAAPPPGPQTVAAAAASGAEPPGVPGAPAGSSAPPRCGRSGTRGSPGSRGGCGGLSGSWRTDRQAEGGCWPAGEDGGRPPMAGRSGWDATAQHPAAELAPAETRHSVPSTQRPAGARTVGVAGAAPPRLAHDLDLEVRQRRRAAGRAPACGVSGRHSGGSGGLRNSWQLAGAAAA